MPYTVPLLFHDFPGVGYRIRKLWTYANTCKNCSILVLTWQVSDKYPVKVLFKTCFRKRRFHWVIAFETYHTVAVNLGSLVVSRPNAPSGFPISMTGTIKVMATKDCLTRTTPEKFVHPQNEIVDSTRKGKLAQIRKKILIYPSPSLETSLVFTLSQRKQCATSLM